MSPAQSRESCRPDQRQKPGAARYDPILGRNQILPRLAEGTLTAVCLLAPHLTPENQLALLEAARHKSKREVQQTNGRRCTERGFVEFHHVVPYADGGEATISTIELRCKQHNAYEAERWFGAPSSARERAAEYGSCELGLDPGINAPTSGVASWVCPHAGVAVPCRTVRMKRVHARYRMVLADVPN